MIVEVLLGLDSWTAGRVVVTAGFYGAALLAVGGQLFRLAFPDLPPAEALRLRLTSLLAAWLGILLVLLLWPLQAAYLGGGSLAAATDPLLLGIVMEGAQGHRLWLAVAGLLLLQANLAGVRWRHLRHGASLLGVILVLLAFTRVGHTRGDGVLGTLLVLHLLVVSSWLAALMPLYRLAGGSGRDGEAVRLLRRFGRFGMWLIPLLLVAGGSLMARLTGGWLAALPSSAYGQMLLLKLGLVALLLSLGALNRWRWVPDLARGMPGAGRRLRLSIATEGVLMGAVLLAVSLLLTTSAPAG
ncbi:CopD family protein [Halomonas mongoliensis]|uniref:CopD family protein n=1 Tax=Halomonas mongoliensis TaxID=321265 RepID=UPI00403B124C